MTKESETGEPPCEVFAVMHGPKLYGWASSMERVRETLARFYDGDPDDGTLTVHRYVLSLPPVPESMREAVAAAVAAKQGPATDEDIERMADFVAGPGIGDAPPAPETSAKCMGGGCGAENGLCPVCQAREALVLGLETPAVREHRWERQHQCGDCRSFAVDVGFHSPCPGARK